MRCSQDKGREGEDRNEVDLALSKREAHGVVRERVQLTRLGGGSLALEVLDHGDASADLWWSEGVKWRPCGVSFNPSWRYPKAELRETTLNSTKASQSSIH